MRNLKKILALVLALVMSMSLVTIANAADFKDANEIDYEEAVAVMNAAGIINGMDNGDFDPNGTLTREQAAKLITYMLMGENAEKLGIESSSFKDVAVTRWSAPAIEYCFSLGIIDGAGDGNFYPAGKLTGYAFAKMLLTALGYSSDAEGFTGASWSVNVATMAMQVGLHNGLANGITSANITRQEAAQMALNAIKTPLVTYDKSTTVVVNGTPVSFGSGDAKYVTTTLAKEQRISRQRLSNSNEYTVEFGEKYLPKLSLTADEDAFERPSYTWAYNNETIGTYVDYATRVGTFTAAATGKDMYNLLGKTIVDKYDLAVFVDGYAVTNVTAAEFTRSNSRDLNHTGKGVLTEVFVNHDTETVTIAIINTYLAKATADYNEKTDKLNLEVFGYNKATSVHALDLTTDASMTVLGVDFAVEDYKEDDLVLVNIGKNEIRIIKDPEVISETKLSAFSKESKVVAGGETYNYAKAARYEVGVLNKYDDQNLAEALYNIYLDSYGYLIGIDLVEDANTYVFITGYDMNGSNTGTNPASAAAIFTDGTMQTIKVNVDKSTFKTGNVWEDGDGAKQRLHNTWYSYKVNSQGVYTLKYVEDQARTKYSTNNGNGKIDRGNIGLNAVDGTAATDTLTTVAYGNSDTNYITVGLKNLNNFGIINKVKSVSTGIKNTDLIVYSNGNAKKSVDGLTGNDYASGVYALYNSNGYVIAAVVVGKDAASVNNTFYALSDVNYEEYSDGRYYWSVKGIMNGVETVVRERGDWGDLQALAGVKKGDLLTLGLDSDNFVVEAAAKTGVTMNNIAGLTDEEVVDQTLGAPNYNFLNMKGWTLYANANATEGFVVADDCPTALVEKIDDKIVVTYYSNPAAAIKAMQNGGAVTTGRLIATLDRYKTATSVIIIDHEAQGFIPAPGNFKLTSVSLTSSKSNQTVTQLVGTGNVPAGYKVICDLYKTSKVDEDAIVSSYTYTNGSTGDINVFKFDSDTFTALQAPVAGTYYMKVSVTNATGTVVAQAQSNTAYITAP